MTGGKQTALITGSSSGIGLELAKIFAKNNFDLVLVARNAEKLDQLKNHLELQHNIQAKTIAKDLSLPQAPQEIFGQLKSEQRQIDALVNNAGFAEYGAFISVPLALQISQIELNISALTKLTGLFLPEMIARKNGKILNVASTAAFQPGPKMAVYYASKAYVLSFSEALREELKNSGVFVTALCPGPTKTGFGEHSELAKSRLFKFAKFLPASKVALAGFNGLMKNKQVVIPGFINKLLAFSTRLAPRNLITKISRWTLELIK